MIPPPWLAMGACSACSATEISGVSNTERTQACRVHLGHEKLRCRERKTLEGRLLCGRRSSRRESIRNAGLSLDVVVPVTYKFPFASIAMPLATSFPLPER